MTVKEEFEKCWKFYEMTYGMGYAENGADFDSLKYAMKDGFTFAAKRFEVIGRKKALEDIRDRANTKDEKELWDDTDTGYLINYIDTELHSLALKSKPESETNRENSGI